MDRFSRQDIVELSNTINQLDIMDIYRLLDPTTAEYILLKLTWNIHQDSPFWTIEPIP